MFVRLWGNLYFAGSNNNNNSQYFYAHLPYHISALENYFFSHFIDQMVATQRVTSPPFHTWYTKPGEKSFADARNHMFLTKTGHCLSW